MKKLRVFFDADVLFAGSASTAGASHILLRLAEFTLIEGITSEQAVTEAERNLAEKLPDAVALFLELSSAALQVVDDPTAEALAPYSEEADWKDAPILAAACLNTADFLVTFNTRDYWPREGGVRVLKPGELLRKIRVQLEGMLPQEF